MADPVGGQRSGRARHDRHDLVQVAEAADRGGRLGDVLAACAECLTLLGDLRMLAAAVPMAAIPVRPRDYRLSAADAARLRPGGWRRLLAFIGTSRDAVTRPLALSLTTLGVVGLLLTAMPGALPGIDAGAVVAPMELGIDSKNGTDVTVPLGATDQPRVTGSGPAFADPSRPGTSGHDRLPLVVLSGSFLVLGAATFALRRAASARGGVR